MNHARVAGVVLAAGLSTRLGRPKQLEMLGGETLLGRALRIAREAGLRPVIAVVGDPALAASLQDAGVMALWNERTHEGMATSIRAGVAAVQAMAIDGLLLMTCDQVALTAQHLQALCARSSEVTGSWYAGRVGVPAYFPRASFETLTRLEGDKGARALLQDARRVVCEDLALDVDTEADLERARQFVAAKR